MKYHFALVEPGWFSFKSVCLDIVVAQARKEEGRGECGGML